MVIIVKYNFNNRLKIPYLEILYRFFFIKKPLAKSLGGAFCSYLLRFTILQSAFDSEPRNHRS